MKKNYLAQAILSILMTGTVVTGFAYQAPSYMANPRNPPKNTPRITDGYLTVEANLGYNFQNWQSLHSTYALPTHGPWSNGASQFNYGFDINYLYTDSFFVEAGWYSIANSSFKNSTGSGSLHPWLIYAAFKRSVSLTKKLMLFGKTGIAYNHITAKQANESKNSNYWGWTNTIGIGYLINGSWGVNLQYTIEPGQIGKHNSSIQFDAPTLQMVNITLSYKV